MARPREFDENQVLDRALHAFWARGYDATSIEDLVEATGLGRASLYGAFGDKEGLFRKVVQRYLDQSALESDEATEGLAPRPAIEAFVRQRTAKHGDSGQGCFLQLSATTGTGALLIADAASVGMKQTRAWLLKHIKAAQAQGCIKANADPSALADFLMVVLNGTSASARAGLSNKALRLAVDQALERVFGDT